MATSWDKSQNPWVLHLEERVKTLATQGNYVTSDIQIEVANGTQSAVTVTGGGVTATSSYTASNPSIVSPGESSLYITIGADASRAAVTPSTSNVVAGWIATNPSVDITGMGSASDSDSQRINLKVGRSGQIAVDLDATNTVTADSKSIVVSGAGTSSYLITVAPTITGSANITDVAGNNFVAGFIDTQATGINSLNEPGTAKNIYIKGANINSVFSTNTTGTYKILDNATPIGIVEQTYITGLTLDTANDVPFALSNGTGNLSVANSGTAFSITPDATTDVKLNNTTIIENGAMKPQVISGATFTNNEYTITGPHANITFGDGWQSTAQTLKVNLTSSTLSAKSASLSDIKATGSTVTLDVSAIIQKNQAGYVDANDQTFNYNDINTGIPVYAGGFSTAS